MMGYLHPLNLTVFEYHKLAYTWTKIHVVQLCPLLERGPCTETPRKHPPGQTEQCLMIGID